MNMYDFSNAEVQQGFELIPANTIAKAKILVNNGYYDNNIFLTKSKISDSLFLALEYVILEGKYQRRKIFERIGIEGNDTWVNMGRTRLRAILECARKVKPSDESEEARKARQLNSFDDLNHMEVWIKIGVEKDKTGQFNDKNKVIAIMPYDCQANQTLDLNKDEKVVDPVWGTL